MTHELAPPIVARDQWSSHPNYPDQVLLLGSHKNFRRISSVLIEAARNKEPLASIKNLYHRWISAMRSHEAYEEQKLYPYLSQRWGVSFEASETGHDELHVAHDKVLSAFSTGLGVLEALKHHDEVLCAHLVIEEDQVIPLLLSLTPAEFKAYTLSQA